MNLLIGLTCAVAHLAEPDVKAPVAPAASVVAIAEAPPPAEVTARAQAADTPVPATLPTVNPAPDSCPPAVCDELAGRLAGLCVPTPVRYWADADYLLWRVRDGHLSVPVATTGSPAGLGVIGLGDTRVVNPNERFDFGATSGIRITAGGWLNASQNLGLEGSAFLLERRSTGFSLASGADGTPLLARPFFDTSTQTENARILAIPNGAAGRLDVVSSSRLWGAELNGLAHLHDGVINVDALLGFRYLDLQEGLSISDSSSLFGPALVTSFGGAGTGAPAAVAVTDRFGTRNQFYGGQLGTRLSYERGWFGVSLTGKVALGDVHEVVTRTGETTLAGVATLPGGLYVTGSNTGRVDADRFGVIPEVGLKVNCQLTRRVSVTVGYSYLYLSSAARPGDQIDRAVNPTLVPTSPTYGRAFNSPNPLPLLNRSSFDVYGISFGLSASF